MDLFSETDNDRFAVIANDDNNNGNNNDCSDESCQTKTEGKAEFPSRATNLIENSRSIENSLRKERRWINFY